MAATIFSTQQPKSRKRIGPNKVTNGSFAADTNWTKQAGWTISGGKANFSATGVTAYLRQNIGIVQGRTYEITFTLEVSAGDLSITMGTGSSSSAISTPGVNTLTLTGGSSGVLTILAGTTFTGTVDNVSVVEILS